MSEGPSTTTNTTSRPGRIRPHYLRELRLAYSRLEPRVPLTDRRQLRTSADAIDLLHEILDSEPDEVAGVLLLDTKHRVLAWYEVGRGTLDGASMAPRSIIRAALLANAAAIIVAHNHPSGDALPSADDDAVTRKLIAATVLFDLAVLDHVIIGNGSGRSYSYKDQGRL